MTDVKRAADDLRLKTVAYVVEATNDERHLLPGVSFDEQEIRLRILREEDESKPPDGQT